MSDRFTVVITANDLAVALGAAVPFAQKVGYGIPSLEAVQLTMGDDALVAVATNRFVIGYARRSAVAKQSARFLLGVSQAKAVRNTLFDLMDERETGEWLVEIDITGKGLKRSIGFHFEPFAMVFDEVQAASSFPDLVKLINDQVRPGATPEPGPVGLAPEMIRAFLKVANLAKHVPLRWSFGAEMKPARVELEDWFVGLIMPVRLSDKLLPVEAVMPAIGEKSDGAE